MSPFSFLVKGGISTFAARFRGLFVLYRFLKNIAKNLVPRQWLLRHELALRKVLSLGYRGRKYACNVCGTGLSGFAELPTGDLLCPVCGSLPRNRRLWQLLETRFRPTDRVLDFSPSRCLYRAMKKKRGIEYVSSDWAGEFFADKKHDLTAIAEPDDSFDLIICYHVLEHIDDDRQAMRELYRVLKPGGQLLVQTPFKPGGIFEDPSITTPEGRLQHFGQEDHVRVYSVAGLRQRLERTGFNVEVLAFASENDLQTAYFGLKTDEIVLACAK